MFYISKFYTMSALLHFGRSVRGDYVHTLVLLWKCSTQNRRIQTRARDRALDTKEHTDKVI